MSGAPEQIRANSSLVGTVAKPGVRGGALDALRFLAAFFVVAYHYAAEAPIPLFDLHPAFERGYLATDFFLILSGFVLGRAYGKAVESEAVGPSAFFLKRVMRIWPAHLIVLGMTIAVVFGARLAGIEPQHAGRFETSDLLPQAFLVQAWGDYGGGGWNLPSWSLSALVICYAAFPVIWKLFSRLPALLTVGIGAAALFGVNAFTEARIGGAVFDLPFQFGVIRALPMFILGMGLARLAAATPTPKGQALAAGLISLASLVVLQLAGRFDALSIMAISVAIAAFGSMTVTKPSKLAAYGGKISFSLFITHVLGAVFWFGLTHRIEGLSGAALWAAWGGSFVFALALAAAFERFVDAPVQAFVTPRLKALLSWRPFARPAAA